MSKEQLIIFDTTMRDGEQSPGASMTKDEKLRIARALERVFAHEAFRARAATTGRPPASSVAGAALAKASEPA